MLMEVHTKNTMVSVAQSCGAIEVVISGSISSGGRPPPPAHSPPRLPSTPWTEKEEGEGGQKYEGVENGGLRVSNTLLSSSSYNP